MMADFCCGMSKHFENAISLHEASLFLGLWKNAFDKRFYTIRGCLVYPFLEVSMLLAVRLL